MTILCASCTGYDASTGSCRIRKFHTNGLTSCSCHRPHGTVAPAPADPEPSPKKNGSNNLLNVSNTKAYIRHRADVLLFPGASKLQIRSTIITDLQRQVERWIDERIQQNHRTRTGKSLA